MMVAHRQFGEFSENRPGLAAFLQTNAGIALGIFCTYAGWMASLVFFRAPDFSAVREIFRGLFDFRGGIRVVDPYGPWSVALAFALIAAEHWIGERGLWKRISPRLAPPAWAMACAALFLFTCVMAPGVRKAFIYFQF